MTEESTTNSTRSGMEERSTDGEQTTKPEDTDSDVTLIQFPLQTVWRQFNISSGLIPYNCTTCVQLYAINLHNMRVSWNANILLTTYE